MSITEIKNNIFKKLESTEDEVLLDEIYRILNITIADSKPYLFTEAQLTMLQERDEEIQKGNFLSEDDADKELQEWLKK